MFYQIEVYIIQVCVCVIDIQHAFLTFVCSTETLFLSLFLSFWIRPRARHYIAEFYLSNSSHGRYLIDVQVDQH